MRSRVCIRIKDDGTVKCGLDRSDPYIEGASLVGVLKDVPYEGLIETFGTPNLEREKDYKIDVEWLLETPSGVAVIYNWKNGKNYLGERGKPTHEITQWNIGGHTPEVVNHIKRALGVYLL